MSRRSRSFATNAIDAPRIHYERIVYDTVRMLWRHKPLIAAVLAIALAALSIALAIIAPRYTGEAMIKFDFTRDEAVAGESSVRGGPPAPSFRRSGSIMIRPIRACRFRRGRYRLFGRFSDCARQRRTILP